MKLVRYSRGKTVSYGTMIDDKVLCLKRLADSFGMHLPDKIEDFISLGSENLEETEKLLEKVEEKRLASYSLPLEKVKLLAPISSPPKIICLGLNYRDHAEEQNAVIPDEPIIFMKPRTSIIGPNDEILKPEFVRKLDYEAELAIVVAEKTKNIPAKQAEPRIFGYTIFNDISARDIQFKDRQWTRGKGFDTFAPIGPCITSRKQIGDTSTLHIRTWVNDELRQESTTEKMVFNVREVVHHLSRVMTLEPCDVIATGTPAGVGFAMKPRPKFLQVGDRVRIDIENIGVLENPVSK